ncbi:sigma-54 interaction domain-containing protein [Achromobacter spanius]|uniref:Sigma 54-interacting transcriptional regulator n=1 Tax=Achromobacter spanius TaxID=217203 RepID=A0AA42IYT7_9BURK|nr:sigma 54-interacting transcriptional regulator [Achromobacter spanius]MDH0735708.1 sigma 54-interacting transcriptional regulator [Achromobacter spanius]
MALSERLLDPFEEAEFLRLVLDHVSDSLVVVDTTGTIILINEPYCQVLGGRPEDFVGRHIADVIGPATKLHLVAQGKETQVGYPLEVRGHKLVTKQVPVRRNGEIIGAVGFALFSDVSLLKSTYGRVFKTELSLPQGNKLWQSRFKLADVIGHGEHMDAYRASLELVAQYELPVLVSGETGTGKELAAHVVHALSDRSAGPFVWVNCASIPSELIEAELFGYDGGAFTGARQRGKPGKFELATDGVLFLDEIGDMPLSLQASLLRVLQTNEIVRVGGTTPVSINARIICATNRSLPQQIKAGRFREDLYHRLNVLTVEVPALRERSDIATLADRLLERIASRLGKPCPKLTAEDRQRLLHHSWPGNVRELENALTRLLVTSKLHLAEAEPFLERASTGAGTSLKRRMQHLAKAEIQSALAQAEGNKRRAAELLGISRAHLYRMMDAHGITNS